MSLLSLPSMSIPSQPFFERNRDYIACWFGGSLYVGGLCWITYSIKNNFAKRFICPGFLLGIAGTGLFTKVALKIFRHRNECYVEKPSTLPIILRYILEALSSPTAKPTGEEVMKNFYGYRHNFRINADTYYLHLNLLHDTSKLYIHMFHLILREIKDETKRLSLLNHNPALITQQKPMTMYNIQRIICKHMAAVDRSNKHDIYINMNLVSEYPLKIISFERIAKAFDTLMLRNIFSIQCLDTGDCKVMQRWLAEVQQCVVDDLDLDDIFTYFYIRRCVHKPEYC